MISGFARGGQVLNDPQLTQRAVTAADFIHTHMYNVDTHVLLRSAYAGEGKEVAQV